ncbi:MAG: hypothetical protein LBM08_04785 [Dysgonamonadaceae bacterium]|jgi:uncharacterized protein YaaR (DUF327 family)|nr:hypothetical protein [Dysgonamonadaceae bacterium]
MTNTDIANKLTGKITPVGETDTDNERFENLKQMCKLVSDLVTQISEISYKYKDSREFSIKRASDFSSDFLSNKLGITD